MRGFLPLPIGRQSIRLSAGGGRRAKKAKPKQHKGWGRAPIDIAAELFFPKKFLFLRARALEDVSLGLYPGIRVVSERREKIK